MFLKNILFFFFAFWAHVSKKLSWLLCAFQASLSNHSRHSVYLREILPLTIVDRNPDFKISSWWFKKILASFCQRCLILIVLLQNLVDKQLVLGGDMSVLQISCCFVYIGIIQYFLWLFFKEIFSDTWLFDEHRSRWN